VSGSTSQPVTFFGWYHGSNPRGLLEWLKAKREIDNDYLYLSACTVPLVSACDNFNRCCHRCSGLVPDAPGREQLFSRREGKVYRQLVAVQGRAGCHASCSAGAFSRTLPQPLKRVQKFIMGGFGVLGGGRGLNNGGGWGYGGGGYRGSGANRQRQNRQRARHVARARSVSYRANPRGYRLGGGTKPFVVGALVGAAVGGAAVYYKLMEMPPGAGAELAGIPDTPSPKP
jgi:hypothetical protein